MTGLSAPQVHLSKKDLTDEELGFYLSKEVIAVDAEMMGLNIQRDRLCLVQIGDENRKITLVQIASGQDDAPNLRKLMESPDVLKLFHYARTDVAFMKHWLNINVTNFFCTKIASKIARTFTDKHSLREITKEILGKDISKAQQCSDWGVDDLSKDQINYAATDVYYLIPLYENLREMLERENKFELAKNCANFVSTLAELDIYGYNGVLEH